MKNAELSVSGEVAAAIVTITINILSMMKQWRTRFAMPRSR
ncbi:MAG: hypothetical protein ACLT7B_07660 [[Ruminococcus] torques]